MIDPCPGCGCDLEREPRKYRVDILEMHPVKSHEKNRSAHFDLCQRCFEARFPGVDLASVWDQPTGEWIEAD